MNARSLVWFVVFALVDAASCVGAVGGERLDREQLLVFRAANGGVTPVKTLDDWQQRRAETVRGMATIMGPLPGREKRVPLDVKVEAEVDCGSYVRREISYAAEPGARVPAYLLLPKSVIEGGGQR